MLGVMILEVRNWGRGERGRSWEAEISILAFGRSKKTDILERFGARAQRRAQACTGMYAQVVLSATASTTARAIAATTGTLTALPTPL